MKIKKVKNMSQNMMFGFIYRIISLLFPFIIRTVMINVLTVEYLGLSSLFTSILHALNLVELGIGSALVYNMYKPVAENDLNKINSYLNYYKKCYRIIGFIILFLGLLLLPFLKLFINGSYPTEINIYIIYLIYLINTVLTYWLFAYKNSVAIAYQRTDIESKTLIISNLLMYILQIVLLILYKNYYIYIILLPLSTILKNILISIIIDKKYPNIKAKGDLTKTEKKQTKDNIKSLFGHQIAFTVINSADNIILSAVLGLNELAIYNNYYYIFSALVNILAIIFSSIQSGIGNDIILNDKEKVFKNFEKFRLSVYSIIIVFSTCMYALYQPFMKIWMGKNMLLNDVAVLIFVIGFYITQTRRVVTTYKNAAGMWKDDFYKPYVIILVDIIIDIFLIKRLGSIGAMISTIISMGLIAIPWETKVLFKKLFNKSILNHILFICKQTITLVICLFIIKLVSNYLILKGILGLLILLLISLLISIAVILLVNINNKDFKWVVKRIKKLVTNKE